MRSVIAKWFLLVAGAALAGSATWQSGALPAWKSAAAAKPRQRTPAVPIRVIAEGRVLTYPGAEVVVGTEIAGRILALPVDEKSVVKRGDLIAELNSDDLRAYRAEADARAAEASADIRFYEREAHREEMLIARRAGTSQTLDGHHRALDSAPHWQRVTGTMRSSPRPISWPRLAASSPPDTPIPVRPWTRRTGSLRSRIYLGCESRRRSTSSTPPAWRWERVSRFPRKGTES